MEGLCSIWRYEMEGDQARSRLPHARSVVDRPGVSRHHTAGADGLLIRPARFAARGLPVHLPPAMQDNRLDESHPLLLRTDVLAGVRPPADVRIPTLKLYESSASGSRGAGLCAGYWRPARHQARVSPNIWQAVTITSPKIGRASCRERV